MMNQQDRAVKWFINLRDKFCQEFEQIEREYAAKKQLKPGSFEQQKWQRPGGGGGTISLMRGNVFEKVGVNISIVHGKFPEEMRDRIPGTEDDNSFFATGISIVAHMQSPLIPAMHFNTRYIETQKSWFGGGGDMTPTFEDPADTNAFHNALRHACDTHDPQYYDKFKQQCDQYFYLKYRKEPRGIGGIFYDYVMNDFEDDFAFTQDIGKAVLTCYPQIVRSKMLQPWTDEQREALLIKRGRYVEFNLLHDRGVRFGLDTGGNIDAIMMSLPPIVKW